MLNFEYTGWQKHFLTHDELDQLYNGTFQIENFLENQYLLIEDESGFIIDKFVFKNGIFKRVKYKTIKNKNCGPIKPRNIYQELAINMLQDRTTPIKLFHSVAGGGKDFLMSAEALTQLEVGHFKKIIYIRPNVGLADVPEIGYLKGNLKEKLDWTLAPLWDKFDGQEFIDELQEENKLEMVPLPFIRGRSFEESIVYVSEGQNITRSTAAVIMSRLGEGSELWINGDCNFQLDKKIYEKDNGLGAMINKLKGERLFQMVYSPIVERSRIACLAGKLMEN